MIHHRHTRGDSFLYHGVIGFLPDPSFVLSDLSVLATARKSHGGPKIQDLTVLVGDVEQTVEIFTVPIQIIASPLESSTWPIGPIQFDVQISYQGEKITSKSVDIFVDQDQTFAP